MCVSCVCVLCVCCVCVCVCVCKKVCVKKIIWFVDYHNSAVFVVQLAVLRAH